MRLTRSLSLRSILVVALLLVGGFAGASSCARPPAAVVVPLDEAVRRTIAAGSARLAATITSEAGAITVSGRTAWREPRAEFVTEADGAPPVEVRVTASGTWLRTGPDGAWNLVPPAIARTSTANGDWAALLGALEPVGPPRAGRLRVTHAGAPGIVDLDADGRIRRLRVEKGAGVLDLRLSDHGIEVDVADP